jgi:hypothetical protein
VNSGRASRLALASPMMRGSAGARRVSGGREEMAEQGGKDDN